MKRYAPFLFVFAVLGTACSGREVKPNLHSLEPGPAYRDALDAATRKDEILANVSLHTYAIATLTSPDYREAFEAEHANIYGASVTPPALFTDRLTFVIALGSSEPRLHDLNKIPPPWTVEFAAADTAPVLAGRIEVLERDTLFLRYFFPYWTPWRKLFKVEFPLPASTQSGTLTLQGVGGTIRLTW